MKHRERLSEIALLLWALTVTCVYLWSIYGARLARVLGVSGAAS